MTAGQEVAALQVLHQQAPESRSSCNLSRGRSSLSKFAHGSRKKTPSAPALERRDAGSSEYSFAPLPFHLFFGCEQDSNPGRTENARQPTVDFDTRRNHDCYLLQLRYCQTISRDLRRGPAMNSSLGDDSPT